MENTMKMYVTADEAAQILGVSRGYAYKIIRGLNNELKEKGYRVISGKVPTKYFEEKFLKWLMNRAFQREHWKMQRKNWASGQRKSITRGIGNWMQ